MKIFFNFNFSQLIIDVLCYLFPAPWRDVHVHVLVDSGVLLSSCSLAVISFVSGIYVLLLETSFEVQCEISDIGANTSCIVICF